MKSLKTVLTSIVLAASFTSASALEVIIPAPASGVNAVLGQRITDALNAANVKTTSRLAGNCGMGYSLYNRATNPVLTLAYNGFSATAECPVQVTKDNLIATLFAAPIVVCARPDVKDPVKRLTSGDTVTFGIGGADWPAPVFRELNPNMRVVTYPGSGVLLKGFAAGDTEFMTSGLLRASELMKLGKANCLGNTGNTEIMGIPPAKNVFPNWKYANSMDQAFVLIGKNMTPEQLAQVRKVVADFIVGPEWTKFLADSGTTNIQVTIENFNETATNWARR